MVEAVMGYVFVSCDIVGHSGEPDLARQREHLAAINDVVRHRIAASGPRRVVWASGGDGGHIAFAGTGLTADAVDLVVALRRWSAGAGVPLRVVACYGEVTRFAGADGRPQLVGNGINLAGRLVAHAEAGAVLVTSRFRELVEPAGLPGVRFHDDSVLELPYFGRQDVCLMSVEGAFESRPGTGSSNDDRAALAEALRRDGTALEALYRAKRLLQVDPDDETAAGALLRFGEHARFPSSSPELIALADPDVGGDLIRAAELVERRQGDLVCRAGEESTTMFLVLHGELGGFAPHDQSHAAGIETPEFVFGAGELFGELAFALRRPRTATIWCLRDTALLAFNVRELAGSGRDSDRLVREALERIIRRRIVEHVARTARYLAGPGGPLPETETTWSRLRRNAELVTLDWRTTRRLTRDAPVVRGLGLYVLVSGRLVGASSGRRLSGMDQPLVYFDLPDVVRRDEDYDLDSDEVMLLALRVDDLLEFGARGFRAIVACLREEAEPAGGRRQPVATTGDRARVFVSYAHDDVIWRERLEKHLQPLVREGGFEAWDDTRIPTGARWLDEIERELGMASVAVLLVSGSFLASRFITESELPALLRAQQERGLRVVWVPISASNFDATELGDIQAARDPAHPLDRLRKAEREEALAAIARTIAAAARR